MIAPKTLSAQINSFDWLSLIKSKFIAWQSSAKPNLHATILVMIVDHKGSAPREKGSWMIISEDEEIGTLGGGELEYQAIAFAKDYLSKPFPDYEGKQSFRIFQTSLLGPDLGQCCGGAVSLIYERIDNDSLVWMNQIPEIDNMTKATATAIGFDLHNLNKYPFHIYKTDNHDLKSIHSQSIEDKRPLLTLFGAGHVGQAIALSVSCLPIKLNIIDARKEIIDKMILPANVTAMLANPLDEIANIPKNSAVLVITHNHGLDYEVAKRLLLREDFSFIGVIGSKTKTARFRKNLKEDGISDMALSHLTMPLAPNAPKSKEPGVIALGIIHEILKIWYG